MRADKLEFNISYSDSAYPENASKLRVFCYMKNGGYAFGDEFEDKYSATFDSNRTSKYSGYGTITIQLLDAEENLINSANVVCKIIESNSTTPFIVSPDFTEQSKLEVKQEVQAIIDNGKLQIVEATKKAKEEIDSWTDQSSRIAKNESNITDLQLFKANTGALHFNGGNAQCSGLANKPIPNINTIVFRWKCDAITFANIPVGQRVIGYVGSWYHLARIGGGLQFYVKYVDGPQYIGLTESNIITLLTDGNWHNVAIINTGTTFDFAIDGKILKSVARSKTTNFAIPTSNFIVSYSTTNIGSIADVFIFNFDITADNAPYTLADYQNGKPIPPTLLRGSVIPDWDNPIYSSMLSGNFERDGENIDATISNGGSTTPEIRFNFSGKKGDVVRVKSNITFSAINGSIENATVSLRNSSNGLASNALVILSETEGTLIATEDFTRLRLQVVTLKTQDEISLTGTLSIEANGTLLALEDYTITNGNSKIVFDYSGNNNDATITGNVNGDNDNRVQKLIDFIKS